MNLLLILSFFMYLYFKFIDFLSEKIDKVEGLTSSIYATADTYLKIKALFGCLRYSKLILPLLMCKKSIYFATFRKKSLKLLYHGYVFILLINIVIDYFLLNITIIFIN